MSNKVRVGGHRAGSGRGTGKPEPEPRAAGEVRADGFRRGEGVRLLIVIHHLAVDGVSWRILLEDMGRAYQQLREGEEVRLPAKTTSFKQWAEMLEEYVRSQEVRRGAGVLDEGGRRREKEDAGRLRGVKRGPTQKRRQRW